MLLTVQIATPAARIKPMKPAIPAAIRTDRLPASGKSLIGIGRGYLAATF